MPLKKVIDWLTDPNNCFLIGSGCSCCAGKPLMEELTKKVIENTSKEVGDLISKLKGTYGRKATIEDLINHLLQKHKMLSGMTEQSDGTWTLEHIEENIKIIQNEIINAVGTEWEGSEKHKDFLARLVGQTNRKTLDIFILNYDTVIEASLEEIRHPYTDGFRGSENAFFDPRIFDEIPSITAFCRLYKIHGSINWYRDEFEIIRRKPTSLNEEKERVVIYPAEQKYIETQYGIYENLLNSFRQRLREERPNNKLIILGYSLSDEHINIIIEDGIKCNPSLTVFAFLGAEKNQEKQIKRLENMTSRLDNRFNVMIGKIKFLGNALENEEWNKIKDKELWKFENILNLITGVPL